VAKGEEYRIGELALAAGVPVRTLRYYQERKLLPPPRREGRVGWYSDDHLARLRIIANLLERGHTLEGIRELLSAWEEGRDVAELLGIERAVIAPWSTETPVTMSAKEMAALFPPGQATAQIRDQAVAMGIIVVDGDQVTHWSHRQLDATVALVRAGVPLAEVIAVGRELRRGTDELAALFVRLVTTHVLGRLTDRGALPDHELAELAETIAVLRPGAQRAVEAAFARAMDRRVRLEIDAVLGRLAGS
jgi:DNA-binding transcriptional MerR regulator